MVAEPRARRRGIARAALAMMMEYAHARCGAQGRQKHGFPWGKHVFQFLICFCLDRKTMYFLVKIINRK